MLTVQVGIRSHPCDLVYSVKFSITCDSDRGECLIRGEGLSLRKKAFSGGEGGDAEHFSWWSFSLGLHAELLKNALDSSKGSDEYRPLSPKKHKVSKSTCHCFCFVSD